MKYSGCNFKDELIFIIIHIMFEKVHTKDIMFLNCNMLWL